MSESSSSALRVFGLWLLYAFVGLVVLLSEGGIDPDQQRSPTRLSSKLVSAASGILLMLGALGWYLLSTPSTKEGPALALALVGGMGGGTAAAVAWVMIGRDLRGRRSP